MTARRSLSEILRTNDGEAIRKAWDATEAAKDNAPLPAAEYIAHVAAVELFNSRTNGTPGVKLSFRIIECEYEGRFVWHDCWLTEAALPMTKRDLAKLGIMDLEQLDQPVPPGIRCAIRVMLRTEDDGTQYNRVRSFSFMGIDEPERDPFAPVDTKPGEAAEPAGDVDLSFPTLEEGGPTA